MRLSLLLLPLLLLSSCLFASTLSIKVTVTQDTLAVGTNVSIVTEGVTLEEKKAGPDGYARFNLSDGSYFVQLRRYPYPLHVSLVDVKGDTDITLTMRQLISYANAYGQVFGPSDFSYSSVTAYQNGLVVKKADLNSKGMYFLSFLPEGEYELEFRANGYVPKRQRAYLSAADFAEVNAALEKFQEAPPAQPTLSAPGKVQQFSAIEVYLARGSEPVMGAEISVQTPSGIAAITTGKDGKARINAAEAGAYRFSYQNLTALTAAVGKAEAAVPAPAAPKPPEQEPPPIQQQAPSGSGTGELLFVALAFLSVVGIAAIVIVAVSHLKRKKKHRK